MRYPNIIRGTFVDRPNRFLAHVKVGTQTETVHIKNTGRCRELLLPGADVWLTAPETAGRKTKYDLVTVRKSNGMLVNIDSQAPNAVVREWLQKQPYNQIRPEFTYGDSRIDFYLERENERILMEVKGCTLEVDGIGYFPDAPTDRGIKHLHELEKAAESGYRAILAFVIQMDGVYEVRPNLQTHPEFGAALEKAKAVGMQVLFLPCHVAWDGLWIRETEAGLHDAQGPGA